jgi:HK97 family phage major capsid protein
MFARQNLSNFEAESYFEKVFGAAGIANETIYYDPIRGIDKRVQIGKKLVEKAPSMSTTSGGTYTGYSMLPPFVDPSIVDRTVRETPLVKLIARRAVRGRSYVYNILSSKAGAVFVAEDAALSESVDTRATGTASMSYLSIVGRVTGPTIASETIIDLMAEDIRVKTASMNEALENQIINGNTTTDPLGFNGLLVAITTNTTNNSGANITLEQIRTDINTSFEANGLIDLAVTDGYTFNYIKGLLMDFQRNVERPSGAMDFGIPDAFTFDGVLFIKDRYMPTTAASRQIVFLDTRYLFLAVLQDYTYEELAKTNDSQKYYIKWYGTLVLNFEAAMVRRYGLA